MRCKLNQNHTVNSLSVKVLRKPHGTHVPALPCPLAEPSPYPVLVGIVLPVTHNTLTNINEYRLVIVRSQLDRGKFTRLPLRVTHAKLMQNFKMMKSNAVFHSQLFQRRKRAMGDTPQTSASNSLGQVAGLGYS